MAGQRSTVGGLNRSRIPFSMAVLRRVGTMLILAFRNNMGIG